MCVTTVQKDECYGTDLRTTPNWNSYLLTAMTNFSLHTRGIGNTEQFSLKQILFEEFYEYSVSEIRI